MHRCNAMQSRLALTSCARQIFKQKSRKKMFALDVLMYSVSQESLHSQDGIFSRSSCSSAAALLLAKEAKFALGFRVFYRRSTYICWDVACAPHWMGCWLYHMRTFSSMWVGFVAPLCSVFVLLLSLGGSEWIRRHFFARIKKLPTTTCNSFWPWQAHTFAWVHCVYRRRAIT